MNRRPGKIIVLHTHNGIGKNCDHSSVRTIPLTPEAMEKKLEVGQAMALDPQQRVVDDCPFITALTKIERAAWKMHVHGIIGKEIGEMLGLRKDEVSRLLDKIREKIRFMHRFWAQVRSDETLINKFVLRAEIAALILKTK